jgi:primosomal protein N'
MGTIPERLVESLNRSLGREKGGVVGSGARVVVGTERDLAGSAGYDVVVVADTDGMALGHNYRAEEEALRILARLGNMVTPGPGRRMILQTSMPDSPVVSAMKGGDPIPYLETILAKRVKDHLPPAGVMIAIEIRGTDKPDMAHRELADIGAAVLGPAPTAEGHRWLIQGQLTSARPELRALVSRWRERGLTVRVDVDPIDL